MKKLSQIDELLKRITLGDSSALIEASALASDENASEETLDELFDGLDFASLLYAVGMDGDDEFEAFREIVNHFRSWQNYAHTSDESRRMLARLTFEASVIERVLETDLAEDIRLQASEELEQTKHAIQFTQQEIIDEKSRADYYSLWLDEARKMLKHLRFALLPKEVFDDLVESVSSELELAEEHSAGCSEGACCENDDDEGKE